MVFTFEEQNSLEMTKNKHKLEIIKAEFESAKDLAKVQYDFDWKLERVRSGFFKEKME